MHYCKRHNIDIDNLYHDDERIRKIAQHIIRCNSHYKCGWMTSIDDLSGRSSILNTSADAVSAMENKIILNGKYVTLLKKKYFVPKETDWNTIYTLAQIKKMPIMEYQYVLAGCPVSPGFDVNDDDIIAFFERNKLKSGQIFIKKIADLNWVRAFADSNNMSVKDLAALFGYTYIFE